MGAQGVAGPGAITAAGTANFPGGNVQKTVTINLPNAGSYVFMASGTDSYGGSVSCVPVNASNITWIVTDTSTPVGTVGADGGSVGFSCSTWSGFSNTLDVAATAIPTTLSS